MVTGRQATTPAHDFRVAPDVMRVSASYSDRRPTTASSRSHEKLDVAESGVAIDEVNALETDSQPAIDNGQRVGRPGRIKLLVVIPGFHVVHGRPGHIYIVGFIALVDLRSLQDMVATALGVLRKRPVTLEPLDPDGEEELVLIHQRRRQQRIGLTPPQRHPIDPVLSE